jgi:hypothetical protein
MDPRNPFSKGLKKLKRKLAGGGRKRVGDSRSENDREGREADIGGGEASQRNPFVQSGAGDVVDNGPSREGNDVGGDGVDRVDPPTSTPSVPHSGEPGGK